MGKLPDKKFQLSTNQNRTFSETFKREKVKEEEVIERMSWGKKLLGNVSLRIEKYLLDSNDVKDFE